MKLRSSCLNAEFQVHTSHANLLLFCFWYRVFLWCLDCPWRLNFSSNSVSASWVAGTTCVWHCLIPNLSETLVSSLGFYWCDKCHDWKQLGEEMICFSFWFTLLHGGKSEQEVKAKIWRQKLKQRPWKMLSGLLSMVSLAWFLIQSRITCSGKDTHTMCYPFLN